MPLPRSHSSPIAPLPEVLLGFEAATQPSSGTCIPRGGYKASQRHTPGLRTCTLQGDRDPWTTTYHAEPLAQGQALGRFPTTVAPSLPPTSSHIQHWCPNPAGRLCFSVQPGRWGNVSGAEVKGVKNAPRVPQAKVNGSALFTSLCLCPAPPSR